MSTDLYSALLLCSDLLFSSQNRFLLVVVNSWQAVASSAQIFRFRPVFKWQTSTAIPNASRPRLPIVSRSEFTWNIIRNFSDGAELPTHEDAKRSSDMNNEEEEDTECSEEEEEYTECSEEEEDSECSESEEEDNAECDEVSLAIGGSRLFRKMIPFKESGDSGNIANRYALHKAVDVLQELVCELHGRDRDSVYKSLRISIEALKLRTTLEDYSEEL